MCWYAKPARNNCVINCKKPCLWFHISMIYYTYLILYFIYIYIVYQYWSLLCFYFSPDLLVWPDLFQKLPFSVSSPTKLRARRHSPFIIVAVVKHPHGDADRSSDDDQQEETSADWSNYDSCVWLRKRFWTQNIPALRTHNQWPGLWKNRQEDGETKYWILLFYCKIILSDIIIYWSIITFHKNRWSLMVDLQPVLFMTSSMAGCSIMLGQALFFTTLWFVPPLHIPSLWKPKGVHISALHVDWLVVFYLP